MRRAAWCAFGGVLLMGVGGLVGGVLFLAAVVRILLGGLGAGGRLLLTAFAIGLGAQLLGTALLRLGAVLLRRAAPPGATGGAPRGGGVTVEGEVVPRNEPPAPRIEREPPR